MGLGTHASRQENVHVDDITEFIGINQTLTIITIQQQRGYDQHVQDNNINTHTHTYMYVHYKTNNMIIKNQPCAIDSIN